MTKKILIINGPNLNILGKREQSFYGKLTLSELNEKLFSFAKSLDISLSFKQSNSESEIISLIHTAYADKIECIIINAAAYTHTSIAIRDAFLAVQIPFIEVHMSNVYAREPFRHKSFLSDIAVGVIAGFKENSYFLAVQAAWNVLNEIVEN